MLNVWAYTITSVVLISLISLIGIFALSMRIEVLKKIIFILVSFAVGGLLGDAFIHLIPESVEKIGSAYNVSILVLAGMLLYFILEKFVLWRHCHEPTSDEHPHPVVFMNFIGDAVHNMFDGFAVGASYVISIPLGIATTLAVILHEIPHEMGNFGVFVHGGLSPRRALVLNFFSALFAIAGALIILLIGARVKDSIIILLPLTAGGFIYVAGSDLIPSLHDDRDFPKAWLQLVFILLGISIMFLLLLVTK